MYNDQIEIKINKKLFRNFVAICKIKKRNEDDTLSDLVDNFLKEKKEIFLLENEGVTKETRNLDINQSTLTKIKDSKQDINNIVENVILEFVNNYTDENLVTEYMKKNKLK